MVPHLHFPLQTLLNQHRIPLLKKSRPPRPLPGLVVVAVSSSSFARHLVSPPVMTQVVLGPFPQFSCVSGCEGSGWSEYKYVVNICCSDAAFPVSVVMGTFLSPNGWYDGELTDCRCSKTAFPRLYYHRRSTGSAFLKAASKGPSIQGARGCCSVQGSTSLEA